MYFQNHKKFRQNVLYMHSVVSCNKVGNKNCSVKLICHLLLNYYMIKWFWGPNISTFKKSKPIQGSFLQTKVNMQCIAFQIGIFLIKIKMLQKFETGYHNYTENTTKCIPAELKLKMKTRPISTLEQLLKKDLTPCLLLCFDSFQFSLI
jgi:hypothetical protein